MELVVPALQLERYVKRHICTGGVQKSVQRGRNMGPRREHVLRAVELSAMAQIETDPSGKLEFQNLVRAYLRLAEQAERNNQGYTTDAKKNRDQARKQAPRTTDNKLGDQ